MSDDYKDIINLPHHISPKRPPMPMMDRAAQFSPFAALTGYEDAIRETGRQTDEKLILDENAIETINEKLQFLLNHVGETRKVKLTYFVPDSRKAGGKYVDLVCSVRKIDEFERQLILVDGRKIPFDDLLDIALVEEMRE